MYNVAIDSRSVGMCVAGQPMFDSRAYPATIVLLRQTQLLHSCASTRSCVFGANVSVNLDCVITAKVCSRSKAITWVVVSAM